MRPYLLIATLAATLLSGAGAFAFHPADPSVRGALDPDQHERIEFLHVQSGWYHGTPPASAARAQKAARPAKAAPYRSGRLDR